VWSIEQCDCAPDLGSLVSLGAAAWRNSPTVNIAARSATQSSRRTVALGRPAGISPPPVVARNIESSRSAACRCISARSRDRPHDGGEIEVRVDAAGQRVALRIRAATSSEKYETLRAKPPYQPEALPQGARRTVRQPLNPPHNYPRAATQQTSQGRLSYAGRGKIWPTKTRAVARVTRHLAPRVAGHSRAFGHADEPETWLRGAASAHRRPWLFRLSPQCLRTPNRRPPGLAFSIALRDRENRRRSTT